MGKIKIFIFTLMLLFTLSPVYAQDSLRVEYVGELYNFWSTARGVGLVEDRVYVATGSGVHEVEFIRNEAEVVCYNTQIPAYEVFISDRYVFALGRSQLSILTRDRLDIVGTIELDEHNRDIAVHENIAYIADHTNGLTLVDVAEPNTPVQISNLDLPEDSRQLTYNDGMIYVAAGQGGLRIINVSDPENPVERGFYQVDNPIVDVEVMGNHVIISCLRDGLKVMDLSNPEDPVEISSWQPEDDLSTMRFCVGEDRIYVLIGERDGITCVVSDEGEIEVTGGFDVHFSSSDIDYHEEKICVSTSWGRDDEQGVIRYDLSNPDFPRRDYEYFSSGHAQLVKIFGNHGFLQTDSFYNRRGINIFSASDDALPSHLGTVRTFEECWDIEVIGNFLYTAASILWIYDISNFQDTYFVCDYGRNGVTSLAAFGQLLIVSWFEEDENTQILDPSDPENIQVIGQIDISDVYIAVSNNLLFTAGHRHNIYDISEPADPVLLGEFDLPRTEEVLVSENNLFVRKYGDEDEVFGFWIVDISDPQNPEIVSFFEAPGYVGGFDVQGSKVYLTVRGYVVLVVDVSNPEEPEVSGFYEREGYGGHDLEVSGAFAYLGDHYQLSVFDCTVAQADNQPPEWVEVPEVVVMSESEILNINIEATDFNQDEIIIEMDLQQFPDGVEFTDNGDGTASFIWCPGFEDAGDYSGLLTATDGEFVIEHELRVIVVNVNRAPDFFELWSPESGTILHDYSADFQWQPSTDPDDDFINYTVSMCISHGLIDTTFQWIAGIGAHRVLNRLDTLLINLEVDTTVTAEWWVTASDLELSRESEQRWETVLPSVLNIIEQDNHRPTNMDLHAPYPNPFNSTIQLDYDLPEETFVSICVYDVMGRLVENLVSQRQQSGYHSVQWSSTSRDACATDSGIYFVRMSAGEFESVKKIVLMK